MTRIIEGETTMLFDTHNRHLLQSTSANLVSLFPIVDILQHVTAARLGY